MPSPRRPSAPAIVGGQHLAGDQVARARRWPRAARRRPRRSSTAQRRARSGRRRRSRCSCGPPGPAGPPRGPGRPGAARGQLQVERDRLALLVDHRPALARALGDDHLVRQHLDRLAVDLDRGAGRPPRAPRPARRRRRRRWPPPPAGCPCRTACPGRGSCPSRVWSTRSAPAEESGSRAPTLSSSATSARSSSAEPVVRRGRRPARAAAAAGSSPSPRPGPRGRARPAGGPAHLARPARRRPAPRRASGHVARCTDSGRVRRSVGGEQVLPDPLGDERHQRRHQPGDDVAGTRAASRAPRGRRPRSGGASGGRTSSTGRRRTPRAACRPAGCRSCSSAAVDARRPAGAPRESTHRSSTGRSAGGGRGVAGRPAREVRRRGRGRRRCSSRSAAPCGRSPGSCVCPTRRAAHGEPPAAMNQRTASAPCSSISGIGSRMLPRCLDILRPSSARMWPRQTHVLVRRLVEDQRADGHQRVEPAAGLVDRLADELRRVGLLEHLVGALGVRVAPLRERHRPGVVPRVDHLGHPSRRRRRTSGQAKVTSSTNGRCGSRPDWSVPASSRELGQRADAGLVVLARSARSAAACPSSGCARAPSRCCCSASRRSGRA